MTPQYWGPPVSSTIVNALSVDLEDWFHILEAPDVSIKDWERYPSRVETGTYRILELCAAHNLFVTFFVLGWIAQRKPKLIKEIYSSGHEIASHGWDHKPVYQLSQESFRADLRRSVRLLEDLTGAKILGYRAPSFSLTLRTRWMLKIIKEEGLLYDSSLFPAPRLYGGLPGGPTRIFKDPDSGIWEVPISVIRMAGIRVPFSSGGYFRLFPYPFIRWATHRLNRSSQTTIFLVHPRELDPAQPRLRLPPYRSFLCYVGIPKTFKKLERLVTDFEIVPIKRLIETKMDKLTTDDTD
jgi:polysaccharide deacetylase family protein (PEP-CTERM system associated)